MYVRSRYVHVYRRGNRSFFFNSLTLELLEGDDDDYRVWESYAEPRAGSDHETVRTLISQRFLVPAGEDAPGQALRRLKELRRAARQNRKGRIGFIRLSLTERCNMACTYCFQQKLFEDRQPVMSEQDFTATMAWLIAQNHGEPVTVQYFGGEPLLKFELVRLGNRLLREAKREGLIAGYTQTITTNGTLMTDEIAQFLVQNKIDVIFSLDGWRELNDERRVFKSGRGTYDAVMQGIARFRQAGGELAVLITPRTDNIDVLPRIVRHFVEDLGASTIGINASQPTPEGWEVDGRLLAAAIQEIWAYCHERGVHFHAPGTYIATRLVNKLPQIDRCIDGNIGGEMADWPAYITADLKVSPCVVHHQDARITRPEPGALIDDRFLDWHFDDTEHPECDDCIASQICGGPCSLELIFRDNRLNPDRCAFFKAMVEWVITR